jgi:3-oxoacyl-[acyl-carrier protein] reductase
MVISKLKSTSNLNTPEVFVMEDLVGKVALVTGARGGIGSAICRRLADNGAKVVLLDQCCNDDASRELFGSLSGDGHWMVEASVTDSSGLSVVADEVEQRYKKLDVLVNNAGITRFVPHMDLDGLDDELIDEIFRVNWRGAFACVRAFRNLLAIDPGGLVINMSSIASTTGIGSNVAYCASKAALNTLTISLARALAPEIRVMAIAPGWVMGEYARRMDQAMIAEQTNRTPLGRLASADDVARAVISIATQLTFTTGAVIPVDGGRPLG